MFPKQNVARSNPVSRSTLPRPGADAFSVDPDVGSELPLSAVLSGPVRPPVQPAASSATPKASVGM